jgi:hypothetical protein
VGGGLGWSHQTLREYPLAASCFEQALALLRKLEPANPSRRAMAAVVVLPPDPLAWSSRNLFLRSAVGRRFRVAEQFGHRAEAARSL